MKENFEFTEAFVDRLKVPVLVIMTQKPETTILCRKQASYIDKWTISLLNSNKIF